MQSLVLLANKNTTPLNEISHGQIFRFEDPNWGWCFLGIIIGFLVAAVFRRVAGGG